jgi:hypothetical protein
MACGTPVLVSNVSSLPEIVADAAVLVSQTDVAGIAHGLGQLITDEEVRRELRERGLERAGQYAWAAVARRVLDAIARSEAEKQRSLCPLGAARSDRVMDSSALDPAAALSPPDADTRRLRSPRESRAGDPGTCVTGCVEPGDCSVSVMGRGLRTCGAELAEEVLVAAVEA